MSAIKELFIYFILPIILLIGGISLFGHFSDLEAEKECRLYDSEGIVYSTYAYGMFDTYDYQCCYVKPESVDKEYITKNDYFCESIIKRDVH